VGKDMANLPKHGGYKALKSFQMSEIVFDLTFVFVQRYVPATSRTRDQMEQAARSGKQNIAEGSQTSGTSKQSELRLVSVARASLEELLQDYQDFLRSNRLPQWGKDDKRALAIRALAHRSNKSYKTYMTYLSNAESAANCLLCVINQANYLLDQQLRVLQKTLVAHGDVPEMLKNARKQELKKRVVGKDENDDFLKSHGFKALEDGRVVRADDEQDK